MTTRTRSRARARAADALLDGRAVDDTTERHAHHDVERFLSELRTSTGTSPVPTPNAALVALFDGHAPIGRAHEASDEREVGDTAEARVRPLAAARRWLRPAVAPSAAIAVLFGGFAAAGALPAPVQHATARFAAHLGVSLPGAPGPSREPTVRAGGSAGTQTRAPATRKAPGGTNGPTRASTHTGTSGSAPAAGPAGSTSASAGSHAHGPVPPTKLTPPSLPHITVPAVPLPPVTAPTVTAPGLP